MERRLLLGGPVTEPVGHLCCCLQPRVDTAAAKDIFFPLGWETAAVRAVGRCGREGRLREHEPQHLGYITPRQTDAYTDRQMCHHGCSSDTHRYLHRNRNHTMVPHIRPPLQGVWTKPVLKETEMVPDNGERKYSNQRKNRKNHAFTSGKSLRFNCFQPS